MLSVFDTYRHIEIKRSDCSDAYGDILITDLLNYSFPLIQYELGDKVSWAPEKNTVGQLKRLLPVRGRSSDNIVFPNHSTLPGEYLTTLFDNFPDAVEQFYLHQIHDYSIKISYIPKRSAGSATQLAAACQHISELFERYDIPVSFYECSVIPHQGGKLKYIQSDISLGI